MILIADSGSTKTHWKLIDGQSARDIHTTGISPFYLNEAQIVALLKKELLPEIKASAIDTVYFYGTGVSQADKVAIIKNSLQQIFPKAKLQIEHDLLAAARAACGNKPGITCILGTGSNTCLYDGSQIVDNVPSLGFLLGDEGSGANLGRLLLKAYYYRDLPTDLKQKLEAWHDMTKAQVLNDIYHADKPNEATARFARFVMDHLSHPYIEAMCRAEILNFLQTNVLKYNNHQHLPIHFVGSIAFLSKGLITEILNTLQLQPGCFLKEPMDNLIEYHTHE